MEHSIVDHVDHEELSLRFMNALNEQFAGALDMAIAIFTDRYPRKFMHQLVSGQLDMDRLDYLRRDSFYTGVPEGNVNSQRLITMLHVVDDQLVVEEKGIYSVEKFLVARRLMYWQVYLHKTAVCAEVMLIRLIERAKQLVQSGAVLNATPALSIFLERDISQTDFEEDPDILEIYSLLDDNDIWGSIKFWLEHEDMVLRTLSGMLLNRKLLGISFSNDEIGRIITDGLIDTISKNWTISTEDAAFFVKTGSVSNSAYIASGQSIKILRKTGEVVDVADASDLPNIKAMSQVVKKHYLCAPKPTF